MKTSLFSAAVLLASGIVHAQPITGIWKGKMGNSRVELKLIRKGDSLVGTSYYYDSKSSYRRYSVKGYFDDKQNDVIWWDDILIEDQPSRHASANAMLAVADFNCPGEGIMKLDGKSSRKEDEQKEKKELHLVKGEPVPMFPDEWDFLIRNYAYSVAHPELIDSIEGIAFGRVPSPMPANQSPPPSVAVATDPVPDAGYRPVTPGVLQQNPSAPTVAGPSFPAEVAPTNFERLSNRKKILQQVIPVKGDSIELRFYDNAEIDGDSIAVFLNGRLLQEHILLAEQAFVIKIAVMDLQADNELVMVAENLGTIPPNTSLMVALVEDKRYEAHLQSTEGSSAMVRLIKP